MTDLKQKHSTFSVLASHCLSDLSECFHWHLSGTKQEWFPQKQCPNELSFNSLKPQCPLILNPNLVVCALCLILSETQFLEICGTRIFLSMSMPFMWWLDVWKIIPQNYYLGIFNKEFLILLFQATGYTSWSGRNNRWTITSINAKLEKFHWGGSFFFSYAFFNTNYASVHYYERVRAIPSIIFRLNYTSEKRNSLSSSGILRFLGNFFWHS